MKFLLTSETPELDSIATTLLPRRTALSVSASSVTQPAGASQEETPAVPRPGVSMRSVFHKIYPRRTAMRNAILAMTVALTLGTGELLAENQKPDVGPGRIAWFDITTTDLSRSKEFYGKLFDWQFTPVKGTDRAVEIVAGGTAIGTIRTADGKISAFNGLVYVQVTDIQASCQKAKDLGGSA